MVGEFKHNLCGRVQNSIAPTQRPAMPKHLAGSNGSTFNMIYGQLVGSHFPKPIWRKAQSYINTVGILFKYNMFVNRLKCVLSSQYLPLCQAKMHVCQAEMLACQKNACLSGENACPSGKKPARLRLAGKSAW